MECIYIVTDLSADQLSSLKVNCVTVGCLRLPDSVLRCKAAVTRAPYVAQETQQSPNPMAEPWKRSGKPKAAVFGN
jgi:hypothetical protein